MSVPENPWDEAGYGEITAIREDDGSLHVSFANGDEVVIDLATIGVDRTAELLLDDEGSLLVRSGSEQREISWMLIRRLTDPPFRDFLRESDARESRRIGRRLRALRENAGLAQKDAAKLAEMAPSQLAKLERGETDLRISTVQTVLRAVGKSLADISGPDAPEVSIRQLEINAEKAGAPRDLLRRISARVSPRQLPAVLGRGFAWDSEALKQGVPDSPPLGVAVSFKSRSPEKAKGSPLLRLAWTVSGLSSEAYAPSPQKLPPAPEEIRQAVLAESDCLDLGSLVRWTWEQGIPVIPMNGRGFEAAAWYAKDRPVIVLNVSHDYLAYWLFALAHELGHIVLGHVGEQGLVDVDEPGLAKEDHQEKEANQFALDVLVPNSASLFARIRDRSGPTLQQQKESFKWRAQDVAEEAGVDHTLLCLVAANALTDVAEPGDRWGSAINFAKDQEAARPVVQEEFKRHIDLEALDALDKALLEVVTLE
jgi:transcriptional regulator with XRE-family HTH domain